jgi:large subunit ribosomal protein L34
LTARFFCKLKLLGVLGGCPLQGVSNVKRPYQPKRLHRLRVHGFRRKMRSTGGRNVLKARRAKGRVRLTVGVKRAKVFRKP